MKISLSRYYPIFLITSSLLLAATFSFYTLRYKLLDHLTRIMRHFAGNMLLAFLVLSINMVFEVKESSEAGCYIIGMISQLYIGLIVLKSFFKKSYDHRLFLGIFQLFFFLSAFMFMSILSYETFRRIK